MLVYRIKADVNQYYAVFVQYIKVCITLNCLTITCHKRRVIMDYQLHWQTTFFI